MFVQVQGRPDDNPSALAVHRAKVFHAAILKILKSAIRASGKDGFMINSRSRKLLAKIIIAILSMDYEEAYVPPDLSQPRLTGLADLVQHQFLARNLVFPVPFVWFQNLNCQTLLVDIHHAQNREQWSFCERPKLHKQRESGTRYY